MAVYWHKPTLVFSLSLLCVLIYFSRTDFPIVPSGILTPKFSAIVAPIIANVSVSSSLPQPSIAGEYARKGTFSLVWSVPVCVGSLPWSAVIISKSSLTINQVIHLILHQIFLILVHSLAHCGGVPIKHQNLQGSQNIAL